MSTLFSSFVTPEDAERAAAALLDRGASPEDLSIVAHEEYVQRRGQVVEVVESDGESREAAAKGGITTTTPADAAMGAAKGTMVGLGAGIAAALVALTIPGVGIVLGGGALAAALAGTAGAAAAGAAAGGVAGYLKDQGVGDDVATHFAQTFDEGGAILAIETPTGEMDDVEVERVVAKYGARNVRTVNRPRVGPRDEDPPVVTTADSGTVTEERVVVERVETATVVEPGTGVVYEPAGANAVPGDVEVRPTRTDPVTGEMLEGVAIDPHTNTERPVRVVDGRIIYMG
jgi:hypothetical protein